MDAFIQRASSTLILVHNLQNILGHFLLQMIVNYYLHLWVPFKGQGNSSLTLQSRMTSLGITQL